MFRLLLFVLLHAMTLRGLSIIWRSLFEKPDPRTDEALRWYVALKDVNLPDQRRRDFASWLARDPRHAEEMDQVAHVWFLVDETLKSKPSLFQLAGRSRRAGPSART